MLQMDKARIGVLVGSGMGGVMAFSDGVESLIERGHRKISPFFSPTVMTNMGSALLAIETGFMGQLVPLPTTASLLLQTTFDRAMQTSWWPGEQRLHKLLLELELLRPAELCLRETTSHKRHRGRGTKTMMVLS